MQSTTRSTAIAADLRDEILRGQYRCGERLPSERDLADRYGVHRGAVREALKSLEQLGVAEIRPGGARVAPIEEASLDVVEHLINLEDPPDPEIVDQLLEVMSGLFSTAARLCAERANEKQRAEIRSVLNAAKKRGSTQEQITRMHHLVDLCVEASGNLVLKLVRRGVKTDFIEKLHERHPQLMPPYAPNEATFDKLACAIDAKDGDAASNAVSELTLEFRRHAIAAITNERARLSLERMSS